MNRFFGGKVLEDGFFGRVGQFDQTRGNGHGLEAQVFQNFCRAGDRFCPEFNQGIRAFGASGGNRPRHGVNRAILLQGEFGCQEGAAFFRRFNHQNAQGKAGDNPVSLGEVTGEGRHARREFGEHGAALGNVF